MRRLSQVANVCWRLVRASEFSTLLTPLITLFNESSELRTLFKVGVNCAFTSSSMPLSILVCSVSPDFRKPVQFLFQ